jgi:hypothetical protein
MRPFRRRPARAGSVHECCRKYNPPTVDPLHLEEYRQLRATIRERGSLRVVLFLAAIVMWAVAAVLVSAYIPLPLASLLALTLLVSGFEAVHALHVGVERIGRYLYVRYESGISFGESETTGRPKDPRPMWEGAIAAFGAGHRASTRPAGGLFAAMFSLAILVNFIIPAPGATMPELAGLGAIHGLALVRVLAAQRAAAGQRAEDQKRFEEVLKQAR